MSVYTPPALTAVDFALTTHEPVDTTPVTQALSNYTAPALSAADFALTTFTPPTYLNVGWELVSTGTSITAVHETAAFTTYAATVSVATEITASSASAAFTTYAATVSLLLNQDEGPTPAGSSRKRRYFVEIDGQQFIVNSPVEAQALLERAYTLAEQAASKDAERIVSAALPRIRALGKVEPVALKPAIKTNVQTPEVQRIKAEIARIYAEAAQAAELRLLMERQAAQDDEDEAEELMLMGML